MKKFTVLLLVLVSALTLTACSKTTYDITFNSNGGSTVTTLTVNEGEKASSPTDPTKEGFTFSYWYEDDDSITFDFDQAIKGEVDLLALWELIPIVYSENILSDIEEFEAHMFDAKNFINLDTRLDLHDTRVSWDFDSEYISDGGIILPLIHGGTPFTEIVTATYTLGEESLTKTYEILIDAPSEVVITESRELTFENLTTEYDVADGTLNLYFEENGSVPYVKVSDFMGLLEGFVDPDVDFTYTTADGVLEIFYQYYDEDEDETYDLILTVDSIENTVVTNDPAFYWAYVYSTETNYGRHIEYVIDHPEADTDEGDNVVYDLDDYNMDIVEYEGEVVLPYYMANQLLAGSSYYNVYYNSDDLFGIYSLPASGSKEMRSIRSSDMNNEDIPADLLVHTFNMLAFDLDNLYGLQDIMGVDTYYNMLFDAKDDLLTQDAEDFDYAIRDLLLQKLDEPHTSYGYPSYYNQSRWDGPEVNSLSFYGTRFTQWYYSGYVDVDDVIAAKWGTNPDGGWNAYGPNRPYYWFLDTEKTTVMFSLDDFSTADIEENTMFDLEIIQKVMEVDDASGILPVIAEGNKFFYYNNSPEEGMQLEIIIKGSSAAYLVTYGEALETAGYTFMSDENASEGKENGYYVMTVGEVDYMIQLAFDVEYDLLYVGISDSAPETFEAGWPITVNVTDLVYSDSAVFMEMQLDMIIAESPDVEEIILDLSWNTGGNIGALYRIVGFITDNPFRVSSIDGDTGGNGSYYVEIPGIDAYDTLTWSLLITPVTFSAANEMATIFMSNDLGSIIGVTSGGGACSITPILLPNGTAFTTSSNNVSAYRTGAGTELDPYVYHDTEFGIEPDFPIEIEDIYNPTVLLDILAND